MLHQFPPFAKYAKDGAPTVEVVQRMDQPPPGFEVIQRTGHPPVIPERSARLGGGIFGFAAIIYKQPALMSVLVRGG